MERLGRNGEDRGWRGGRRGKGWWGINGRGEEVPNSADNCEACRIARAFL